jgi:hypothetical protein
MESRLGLQNNIPELIYPFAAQVSPFAADVDEECYRWGERQGIYYLGNARDYRRTRVGWLAAYTSPRGSREGLQLLADWQMWLFAFDDGFCDESEYGHLPDAMIRRVTRFLGILEGARSPGDGPFDIALADVTARLAVCSQGFQRARFLSAVRGYFMAQCWETANRATGDLPQLDEYVYMRRHSGAVRTCTALSDVAGNCAVPAADYDHPEVAELTDVAINIICWANDILSYPKEISRSKIVQSLPTILDSEYGIAKALSMHDREVRRYIKMEKDIRAWAGPQLSWYLDELRFWIAGNLEWSLSSGRYRSEEAP